MCNCTCERINRQKERWPETKTNTEVKKLREKASVQNGSQKKIYFPGFDFCWVQRNWCIAGKNVYHWKNKQAFLRRGGKHSWLGSNLLHIKNWLNSEVENKLLSFPPHTPPWPLWLSLKKSNGERPHSTTWFCKAAAFKSIAIIRKTSAFRIHQIGFLTCLPSWLNR